jgi:hypothetical protein
MAGRSRRTLRFGGEKNPKVPARRTSRFRREEL